MRIRLEKRREPSKVMQAVTPVAAVVLTMIIGAHDLLGDRLRRPARGEGDLLHADLRLLQMVATSRAARRR